MAFSNKAVKQICNKLLSEVYEKYGEKLDLESEKEFLDEFMESFTKKLPKKDVKVTKESKDASKPKRPLNSYMRFAGDHRAEVKEEVDADEACAQMNGREKNSEILRLWVFVLAVSSFAFEG